MEIQYPCCICIWNDTCKDYGCQDIQFPKFSYVEENSGKNNDPSYKESEEK